MNTIHARHYSTGEPLQISYANGFITSIFPSYEKPLLWIAPPFFDVQINGCLGIGFNSPDLTEDGVRTVVAQCREHGIGQLLPTLITGGFEPLRHGFATLARAREVDPDLAIAIPGYHLEGPYISGDDGPRGAHPREHVRPPDRDEFRRWQEAARGLIRMVTIAPELPGALPFIEHLTASGIVVAIGHTAATGPQIRDAISAGARTSTHLGNGCHAVLPRHENYLWEQLADDRLWASIIPDGFHLPDTLIRVFAKVKGERLLMTCDAGSLAGMPPGVYSEWGHSLEVLPSGKIVVPGTPFLAGSGSFTDSCVGNMTNLLGLKQAVEMATTRPRELIGIQQFEIAIGQPADFVIFEWAPGESLGIRKPKPTG